MRLTKFEIDTIKEVASEIWGNQTVVYLFGSRTDDTKKGGDIDLYVQPPREMASEKLIIQKAAFLAKLDFLLGEQKIDLLIKTRHNRNLPIIKTAKTTGVPL